mmetsp:Transcript_32836/g.72053  ORF Transcript_32836/g.72053 Transcript_32836/m.72053 type:complete len:174 (+) Transcript_32836:290-811(+)
MGNCCELELEQTAAAATAAADGMSKSPAKITKDTNKTNASTTARVSLNRDSIGTIHENITITDHTKYEDRNVFDYYDKVKVIGWGSTCTIYKVRKKKVRKKKKKKKISMPYYPSFNPHPFLLQIQAVRAALFHPSSKRQSMDRQPSFPVWTVEISIWNVPWVPSWAAEEEWEI